jgi:hypothetical protein
MEKVGMRGPFRESELVETPPHRAESGISLAPCLPLPASGARSAALLVAGVRDGTLEIYPAALAAG